MTQCLSRKDASSGNPSIKKPGEQVSFQSCFGTGVHHLFSILDLLEVWEGPPGSGVPSTGDPALQAQKVSLAGTSLPAPSAAPQFSLGNLGQPVLLEVTTAQAETYGQYFLLVFFFFFFLDLIFSLCSNVVDLQCCGCFQCIPDRFTYSHIYISTFSYVLSCILYWRLFE